LLNTWPPAAWNSAVVAVHDRDALDLVAAHAAGEHRALQIVGGAGAPDEILVGLAGELACRCGR
jgi:hypothetical protein